ncbi:MAG: polymer-forming cytoskeletal protein, partial [Kiloniellales bacterium]
MFRRRKSRNRSINLGLPAKSAAPAEPETPPAKTLKAASAPARVADVLARSARRAGEPVRTGRTLMVGRDISLTGEITSCEKLIVEGRVDGDVSETRRLEINESGGFTGSAVVEECMVAG